MKKLSHILSLLLVSFLLNGCTLMMEDFEIPEEERGVDEPYTEVLPDDALNARPRIPLSGRWSVPISISSPFTADS